MFNTTKNFLKFPYKKKKVTFQDVTMKSSSRVVLTEDFKDILKVLSQEDKKSIHKMHNEFDKVIVDKEEFFNISIQKEKYNITGFYMEFRSSNIKRS